jgi:hypothetical protein
MRQECLLVALLVASAASCSKPSSTAAEQQPAATDPAPAAAPAPAPDTRRAIDCAAVLSGMADRGGAVFKAGGWGAIPAALQVLPEGGELCGAGSLTGKDETYPAVLIRSDAFGAPIDRLYKPILAEMGCEGTSEVVGDGDRRSARIHFTCKDGKRGDVVTDTGFAFYSLSIML